MTNGVLVTGFLIVAITVVGSFAVSCSAADDGRPATQLPPLTPGGSEAAVGQAGQLPPDAREPLEVEIGDDHAVPSTAWATTVPHGSTTMLRPKQLRPGSWSPTLPGGHHVALVLDRPRPQQTSQWSRPVCAVNAAGTRSPLRRRSRAAGRARENAGRSRSSGRTVPLDLDRDPRTPGATVWTPVRQTRPGMSMSNRWIFRYVAASAPARSKTSDVL